MKKVLINYGIAVLLLFVITISPSMSEPVITDTITLNHIPVSSTGSGNLLTKGFKVQLRNITNDPLLGLRITLDYVAGFAGHSEGTNKAIDIGNVFVGESIETEETVVVTIDRSTLTDGIFVFNWLVEYSTLEGNQIIDEYTVVENK